MNNNVPSGPSSADSIRYQQSLQQLDRVLEMTKKMIGATDSSADSDYDEDAGQISNYEVNQELSSKKNKLLEVASF